MDKFHHKNYFGSVVFIGVLNHLRDLNRSLLFVFLRNSKAPRNFLAYENSRGNLNNTLVLLY